MRLQVLTKVPVTIRVRALVLVVTTLGATLSRQASADDLTQAWTREILPAGVSAYLTGACASLQGLLLLASTSAPVPDASYASVAVWLGADGTQRERGLSAPRSEEGLRNVRACVDTRVGYVLVGTTGRDTLTAWWLAADLETTGSMELMRDPSSVMVWGVAGVENDRFAAVLDHARFPVLIFDRESVTRVEPAWSVDKALRLFDVTSIEGDVIVCGIEGDPGNDPTQPAFDDPKVLVARFGADGSERSSARFAGQTCRLFPEADGSTTLLHQSSADRLSALQRTRLDRELKALDSGAVLGRVSFLVKLEAARAGTSFAVLPLLTDTAFDLASSDSVRSISLGSEPSRMLAIRSAGQRVYVISETIVTASERPERRLRVTAFDVR